MKILKEQLSSAIVGQTLPPKNQPPEPGAALVILPILATAGFYVLPASYQSQTVWQFVPQVLGYVCLVYWAGLNTDVIAKLGLQFEKLTPGIRIGIFVGILLGSGNTMLILFAAPALGMEIGFLSETPHAQIPPIVMVPWFIMVIACGVELNFRGFLLGRVVSLSTSAVARVNGKPVVAHVLAVLLSSLVFAFDPFLVSTFQHLHWIAVWDGLIWGWFWLKTRNLYIPMTAHGMEVIIEYLTIRTVWL